MDANDKDLCNAECFKDFTYYVIAHACLLFIFLMDFLSLGGMSLSVPE